MLIARCRLYCAGIRVAASAFLTLLFMAVPKVRPLPPFTTLLPPRFPQVIVLKHARHMAYERLLVPPLVDAEIRPKRGRKVTFTLKARTENSVLLLPDLVNKSLRLCDEQLRPEMLTMVLLAGGGTSAPGKLPYLTLVCVEGRSLGSDWLSKLLQIGCCPQVIVVCQSSPIPVCIVQFVSCTVMH